MSRRLGVATVAAACVLMAGVGTAHAQYGYGGYDRPPPPPDDFYRRPPPPPPDYGYGRPRYDYERPRPRYDDGPPPQASGPQPRGSFVQSCTDINVDGAYLEATCRGRGGGERRSRIDVRTCRSIGNRNGQLICE